MTGRIGQGLMVAAIFGTSCMGGPLPTEGIEDTCLQPAWDEVRGQWPTVQAALDDRNVHGSLVWFWAHQRGSVDGFGAVLATVDERPGIGSVLGLPEDVPARGTVAEPSLLFFDQTDGASSDWPVIGMGFHFPFDPCTKPALDCSDSSIFFVHEAGYHRMPIGDGGMDVATGDDVHTEGLLDELGCNQVTDQDLRTRFGKIRHGRAWTTHVWFPPADEDGAPVWANEDPWRRWMDAPNRTTAEGRAFFAQGTCDCSSVEPVPPTAPGSTRGGCG